MPKKRKDGRYQKSIRVGTKPDGKPHYMPVYGKTLKELDEKAAKILTQLQQGIHIEDANLTFSEIAQKWVNTPSRKKGEPWTKTQIRLLKIHLDAVIGKIPVAKLRQYHLQDLLNKMKEDGYATSTMSKVKQIASQILDFAVENEITMRNVFGKVIVPSVEQTIRNPISEQQRELIEASYQGHRMGIPAMIMLHTGLRRGELLALEWGDIDLDNSCLIVNKAVEMLNGQSKIKAPKTELGNRIVPIPSVLRDILQNADKSESLVCPSTNGILMSDTAYRRAWNSYMHYLNIQAGGHDASRSRPKKIAVERFTAHQLRHTYATDLYEAGVKDKIMQLWLGHADIETTVGRYTHKRASMDITALETYNKFLGKQKGPKNKKRGHER